MATHQYQSHASTHSNNVTTSMTREQQLELCKKCVNRKFDLQQGIICNLTGSPADFEDNCGSYSLDETVNTNPTNPTEVISANEARVAIPAGILEKFRGEQKLIPGVLASLGIGVLGAALWGAITLATNFQIGYMAVAIGAGVGITMRMTGKGIDPIFGICGGIVSLFSVLLGNFFSIVGYVAEAESLEFFETLVMLNYKYVPELLMESFSVIDLIFYGIAVYEGYRFSFRKITGEDIIKVSETQPAETAETE